MKVKSFRTWLFVIAFLLSFCSNRNEVLVEYQNQNQIETIKRKDLQFIVELNGFRKNEVSVATQNQILEELAFLSVGKLAFENLPSEEKQKWENSLKRSLIFLEEKAFLNAMNFLLQEKASEHPYKMITIQLLFLKKLPNLDRSQEAKDLLETLNKTQNDDEIEKLIFEKNENLRYKILGGLVDPICVNCGDSPISHFIDPLLKEKEDEKKFHLIEDSNGYWLIRKIQIKEVKEISLKNLYEDYHRKSQFVARKFFNNPNYTKEFKEQEINNLKQQLLFDEKKIEEISEQQAKHQAKLLKQNSYTNHLVELQKQNEFRLNENTIQHLNTTPIQNWDENLILFEYQKKPYKIKDFFDLIRKYEVSIEALSPTEVANLLNQVYSSFVVLQASPYKNESETFKQNFKDLMLKQTYTNFLIQSEYANLQVSQEEIIQYYNLRKNNEFKVINNNQEMILPLNAVKERIKQNLLTEKRQKKIQEIKQTLFQKYSVKIHKDRLKEGKI
ncbi:MAG: hypothetical protein NZ853_02630 [Leptospiraceae bacterium]|nr:hypothetical protein [Leptospiraceae bacterium]MDW7975075.1 hypothetical protein [Leptospiraceae bacterium]